MRNLQLKRCTGAIWPGHLKDHITVGEYFDDLKEYLENGEHPFFGGAIALEQGEKEGNYHIQYYLEHKPLRPSTLANLLNLKMAEAIGKVQNLALGAYNYCAGLGDYADKPAIQRYVFGEVKCWGSGSGQKADLAGCVEIIVNGNTPYDILKENPYAYAVHRTRIWNLYMDLMDMTRNPTGPLPDDFDRTDRA